ncbi:MAG TPA: type II secretion system protein GspJ [Armatimonadota bacterium]|nr:type II secretion system protein GspJ [Armatimonadota bacterium]
MRVARRVSGRSGFTLVEAMVAIVILLTVIGSIYGAFRAGNLSVSRTEERVDAYQTARILLAQITHELCSAYQPGWMRDSFLGEDTPGSESAQQHDTLMFVTTAHAPPSPDDLRGDLCQVTYYVRYSPGGEPQGFVMEENFHPGLQPTQETPGEQRRVFELSDMVIGFNCQYLDGSREWRNEWVEQSELPKAVRVELTLRPHREGAKPIVVASTANLPGSKGPGSEQTIEEEEVEE